MKNQAKMITLGDADKGGWWFTINETEAYQDGFRTEQDALNAALAETAGAYEIWYDCEANGRRVMIPGASNA